MCTPLATSRGRSPGCAADQMHHERGSRRRRQFILRGLSLRKLAPRRGCCQHRAVRPERFDAELVSVDLARRRRRAGEAG